MFRARSPFDKKLGSACMGAINAYINDLFDSAPSRAAAIARLPFNGEPWFVDYRDEFDLRYIIFHALCQREAFRRQRPPWALVQQLELPLAPLACTALVESPDHRHQLLGYFGRSLIHAEWRWLHPNFKNYSRCLMACGGAAVQALRDDPELQAEFPPKRLTEPAGTVVRFADQSYRIGD
jgi:hypothetical protein